MSGDDIPDLSSVIEEVAADLYRRWPLWTRIRYRYAMLRLRLDLLVARWTL